MSLPNRNVVAVVVARLSSSRLPGKHFKPLLDKPLISWTVNALRKSASIDRIVIATTDRAGDDRLCDFAMQEKIGCYRYDGDVDHVTKRIRRAADEYHADIVVSISGDCPLIHAPTLDRMVEKLADSGAEVCMIADRHGKKCIHEGIGVMTADTWHKVDDVSRKDFYQEHPASYVKDHPKEFSFCSVTDEDIFYGVTHRISVDTPADLEFMNRAFSILDGQGKDIDLPNVIALLHKKPGLMKLNRHVYQKKVQDESRNILFRVNGGSGIGLGHIMREMTVARFLMESHGAGVRFLVNDDPAAKDELARCGYSFFLLPAGFRREEEIGIIKNISDQYKFHAIILDLNEEISVNYIKSLKPLNIPVVSIDNASKGACLADVSIFPVAHFKRNALAHCGSRVKVYGGAKYVVIDEKFHKSRQERNNHAGRERLHVLITFGGTDPNDLTGRVVRVLSESDLPLFLDVVIGPAFRNGKQLEDACRGHSDRIMLHSNVHDLSELMSGADIAFTALGITAYELAYMGTPSVIIANFRADVEHLEVIGKRGISLPLGYYNDVTDDDIRKAVELLAGDKERLRGMSLRGKRSLDGYGAKRIADIIAGTIP